MRQLPEVFAEYQARVSAAKARLATSDPGAAIQAMAAEKLGVELALLYAFDPEAAAQIEDPALDEFWREQLERLLPSAEGEEPSTEHPFKTIAGLFCFYKGCFEPWELSQRLPPAQSSQIKLDLDWLELGAVQFHNYLCCDRYCGNYFDLFRDGRLAQERVPIVAEKCLELSAIALKNYKVLGHSLAALCYYFISLAFKNLNWEESRQSFRRVAVVHAKETLQQIDANTHMDSRVFTAVNFESGAQKQFPPVCFEIKGRAANTRETAERIIQRPKRFGCG